MEKLESFGIRPFRDDEFINRHYHNGKPIRKYPKHTCNSFVENEKQVIAIAYETSNIKNYYVSPIDLIVLPRAENFETRKGFILICTKFFFNYCHNINCKRSHLKPLPLLEIQKGRKRSIIEEEDISTDEEIDSNQQQFPSLFSPSTPLGVHVKIPGASERIILPASRPSSPHDKFSFKTNEVNPISSNNSNSSSLLGIKVRGENRNIFIRLSNNGTGSSGTDAIPINTVAIPAILNSVSIPFNGFPDSSTTLDSSNANPSTTVSNPVSESISSVTVSNPVSESISSSSSSASISTLIPNSIFSSTYPRLVPIYDFNIITKVDGSINSTHSKRCKCNICINLANCFYNHMKMRNQQIYRDFKMGLNDTQEMLKILGILYFNPSNEFERNKNEDIFKLFVKKFIFELNERYYIIHCSIMKNLAIFRAGNLLDSYNRKIFSCMKGE